MKPLADLVADLEQKIQVHDLQNDAVSKGSVGWHIEHSLLTLNMVIEAISRSNPADCKSHFDMRRVLLMAFCKIPRGRVKAPKVVQPAAAFDSQSLQNHISITKQNLQKLEHLNADHFFTHPFLGDFRVQPATRFLRIHTTHHLHIIHDIIKSKTTSNSKQLIKNGG